MIKFSYLTIISFSCTVVAKFDLSSQGTEHNLFKKLNFINIDFRKSSKGTRSHTASMSVTGNLSDLRSHRT